MQNSYKGHDLTHLSVLGQVATCDTSVIATKHDFDEACRCIRMQLRSLALVLRDEIDHQNASSLSHEGQIRAQMAEQDELLELVQAAMCSCHVALVCAGDTREKPSYMRGKQTDRFKSLDEELRDVRILRHVAGHTAARRVKLQSLI